MIDFPLLSLAIFLPLAGAAFMSLIRGKDKAAGDRVYEIALLTTLAEFVLALVLWAGFDPADPSFQYFEAHPWLGDFATYTIGVDGLSLPLILLTSFLMPLCILASRRVITHRVRDYMMAFLVMETLMIGVFASLDLFLFYLFFEGGLIPMFLIIGIWGGERRFYASLKFFLYTLFGSVLMLVGVLAIYLEAGTMSIPALLAYDFSPDLQYWLWLAFFASFAIKTPMWPFHTWLPDAHVEAPTAGSVVLAGVLLKMGGYGFLRFSLPMFPDASVYFADFVFALSVIAIIYASLVALVQVDMKKLIAYSSVAHMGFVTMGLFSGTELGIQGAYFLMLSHGVVSAALFLCVGFVYDRTHSRQIATYGGLVTLMPAYAVVFMIFTMANVGLPGTIGFIGEFLALLGTFQTSPRVAAAAALGVILSAGYALVLYRRVIFGVCDNPRLAGLADMNRQEWRVMAPLIVCTIFYGFYPAPILSLSAVAVAGLAATAQEATMNAATLIGMVP